MSRGGPFSAFSPTVDKLEEYHRKRNFDRTPEPRGVASGARRRTPRAGRFIVQKHAARRLHYDFRLELDGVLLSWAVPRGPSLDPGTRRLAVETEPHPLEYGNFEGVIPRGQYGGGTVLLWDRGTWQPESEPHEALRRGRLNFRLEGEKLRGSWHLVRTRRAADRPQWLLFKGRDAAARPGGEPEELPAHSVLSGRSMEEIAAAADRVWNGAARAGTGPGDPDPAELPGVRRKRLPRRVAPALPTLVDRVPEGDEWLHEVKFDGYRLLARIDGDRIALLTRREQDWAERFPSLREALAALGLRRALIDGEAVVLDRRGVSDFQALQNALKDRSAVPIYHAFDLLQLDDWELRGVPLARRKQLLAQLLAARRADPARIRYSDHVRGSAAALYQAACDAGLEGVVSKRADAPYTSGRVRTWVKTKCKRRQELVVGGFSAPGGTRSHIGALLLGVREPSGALRYAGRVGTGFTETSLRELHRRLQKRVSEAPPFRNPPRGALARDVTWVRPELVAEIEFAEMTRGGHVRHAVFRGLRDDKAATAVTVEQPALEGRLPPGVRLSHPDKVLISDPGITKRELALYYTRVAEAMLPHLGHRPLALVRCPEGSGRPCFFQKHLGPGIGASVQRVRIRDQSEERTYMAVQDLAGILALVQLGTLEFHLWGSRVDDVERPDRLVFDLDPDAGLPWARVVAAAQRVRELLGDLGLTSFVMTTGGKGLHVVVPIAPGPTWDRVKPFCHAVALTLAREAPRRFTASLSRTRRTGRIFIDYLRNGRGASAVCPYSSRARPGATVAFPLAWDELGPGLDPARFTVRTVPALLAAGRDPWAGWTELRQSIGGKRVESLLHRAA
jgi:bifunctional non-homologous end joining protein LigD